MRNPGKFLAVMTWASMIRDGLAMRRSLTSSQVVMAADTPMLLEVGLVEGDTTPGSWLPVKWPSRTCRSARS